MLSKISQRKRNTVCYHLYVESRKYNKLVNITKKKQTHGYRNQTSSYHWREASGKGQYKRRGYKNFFHNELESMICKRKIEILDFIKIKNFFSVKDPIKRIKKKKNKLQARTKYFKTIYPTKGSYLEYIKNSYYSTANPIRKWAKDMKIHFTKLNIHMANKHMKSCSTSQPIKEMPIKATVKYHCTPLS